MFENVSPEFSKISRDQRVNDYERNSVYISLFYRLEYKRTLEGVSTTL